MALKIFTTGIEQYAPGGNATIKTMVIGGPGAGKTRWSSFWPKPFYLACEAGLASVADRKVPAVEIKNSQDMLEALTYLKQDSMKPADQRLYKTVIIDTLDAMQRKIKDEWLQKHPNEQSFKGYDAWGYLDAKMQMLLTRIMNLDVNVIILVHFTDKIVKNGDEETHVIALQLDGKIKDSIFNDFDLVGWMGTYWEAENGQRVQKRGLTFKPSFDKPFLKDRLHVTPQWMEVDLSSESGHTNYDDLFAAFSARMDDMSDSEVIGEVPTLMEGEEGDVFRTPGVVGPGVTGALPPIDPKEIPLSQFDKPTLAKMCREDFTPPITTLPDGTPIKGNTLKGELVAAIEARRKADAAVPPTDAGTPAAPAPESPAAPVTEADAQPASTSQEAVAETPAAPSVASNVEATTVTTVQTDEGEINPATGEIVKTSEDQALDAIESVLGGAEVISVTEPAEDPKPEPTPAPAPAPAAPAAEGLGTCGQDGCEKDLSGEHPDLVKLSYIKFRTRLCNDHYKARRAAG